MAGCHLRSRLLWQTGRLATCSQERWFMKYSRPILSISSDYKDHRHSGSPLNRQTYPPFVSSDQRLKCTQFRNLHLSQTVLFPDKETVNNKEADKRTDNINNGKSDQSVGGQSENAPEKLSVFQRFKKTYKEHGKVLIAVHLVTSSVWFGSFFYAAKVGVDIIPVMEWLGLPEKAINPFRNSSLGDVALAYLMYKLATPARYTVTLAGTNYAIKYLRKVGKMQPKDKNSSLRVLAKDSQTELRQKRREVVRQTHKFETKLKERRVNIKDRLKKFRSKLKYKQLKALASRKSKKPRRSKK